MNMPRRSFIKQSMSTAALLAIPTLLPRHVIAGSTTPSPSRKVNIGLVGVGGQGRDNALQLMKLDDVQIVAIADPAPYWDLHEFYYQAEAGSGPVRQLIEAHYQQTTPHYRVRVYDHFEDMLEQEVALDAIVCSTPDHTHFYVSATALKAGKHVYCEKPLTHNIWEAREIARIARESGLATQMGNRGHSRSGIRRTVELLQSGVIGEVQEAHSWAHATRWNQGLAHATPPTDPVPEGFNWDLWLGPRNPIPYSHAYSPVKWRDFWPFGTGALGDFGCHDMDAAVWAFNLHHPSRVCIHPGGFPIGQWQAGITPYSEIGSFDFAADGKQQALKLHWYSGGLRPAHHEWVPEVFKLGARGELFVGSKGLIQTDGAGTAPRVFPRELKEEADAVPRTLPRSDGHFRDWIDAIQSGTQSSANFEYSARLTEIVLLGVLSLRLEGEPIHWDPASMSVRGLPHAADLIREPVREGWNVS
ncbi:MAG: Gfo/Idh/MocA family oxidoreductase [Puniceicoccaceae bacterium]